MRISDWSSDVCSSYLWETQSSWNAVAQNLLGAPTYSPGYRFLFDQDNVDCPWAAALRIRHFLAHNSVDGFEYPHGLTLEQYQNLRRSEEHTSELQSLMRISYAVFCLKKKKQTINNTLTHTSSNY